MFSILSQTEVVPRTTSVTLSLLFFVFSVPLRTASSSQVRCSRVRDPTAFLIRAVGLLSKRSILEDILFSSPVTLGPVRCVSVHYSKEQCKTARFSKTLPLFSLCVIFSEA